MYIVCMHNENAPVVLYCTAMAMASAFGNIAAFLQYHTSQCYLLVLKQLTVLFVKKIAARSPAYRIFLHGTLRRGRRRGNNLTEKGEEICRNVLPCLSYLGMVEFEVKNEQSDTCLIFFIGMSDFGEVIELCNIFLAIFQ